MDPEEVWRDIPPEKLKQHCWDEHLCLIAHEITDWPSLTPFLGMTRPEMEAIRGKWPFNIEAQKPEFLRKWQEKCGCKATYQRLYKAFLKAGDTALAEKVYDILCEQESSSESTSNENEDEGINVQSPAPPNTSSGSQNPSTPTSEIDPLGTLC